MKKLFSLAAMLLLAEAGLGQEILGTYNWQDLSSLPPGASLVQLDGRSALKIENTKDAPLQIKLLTIMHPKVTAQIYKLSGEVKYEAVQGDGFLELWNYFPPVKPGSPDGQYFSRTLGDSGPMGKINGTSGWRKFALPFDRTGADSAPVRLELNLVLPGRGTVYLGPVKTEQMPRAKSASEIIYPQEWWSPGMTNNVFGWGGGVAGCLGVLCAALASKGRARSLVMIILWVLTGLGVALAVGGLVAVAVGQPPHIWWPMFLGAVILTFICPINLRRFRQRYEDFELRRMASLDASGA